MLKKIKAHELCDKLEEKLLETRSNTTVERYSCILSEFSSFAGDQYYRLSLGADFLLKRFSIRGGVAETGRYSKSDKFALVCMKMLSDYYLFEVVIIYKRQDDLESIVWPEPFRSGIEDLFEFLGNENYSFGYYKRIRGVLVELVKTSVVNGAESWEEINKQICLKYIDTLLNNEVSGISTRISALKMIMKFLYLNSYIKDPVHLQLPKINIRGRRKLPSVFTTDEIKRIKDSIDRTSPDGKRRYAMILLAVELGLRISDIKNLEFSNIDWEKKEVRLTQNKTGFELLLPLSNDLGWALIDYIKNGRPIVKASKIFVTHRPPYHPFQKNSTCNHILTKAFIDAGIKADPDRGNLGWHSFRRSLATYLIQNGVELNTVSEILGHSDPNVTSQKYIKLDEQDLRLCSLSVEVKDYVK